MNIADIMTATAKGRPTRLLVHSIEGWGKTWLAAHFPEPVWIAPENGFPRDLPFQPRVIQVREWLDMFRAVDMLLHQEHRFLTLIIDTMDWIEPMLHRYLLQRDSGRETDLNKKGRQLLSIEEYGYGKGYIAAEEELVRWFELLSELQSRRNMHVVILCHSQVKTFKNPAGEDFDRWQPKMHERVARKCVEWAETVAFGFYDLAAGKIGDEKRAKGVSDGKRLVGLRYSAMYDAKNRLGLPPVIELTDTQAFVGYLLGLHMPHAAADVEPVPPPTEQQLRDRKLGEQIAATYNEQRDPTDTGRMHSRAQLDQQRRDNAQQLPTHEVSREAPRDTSRPGPIEHAQGVVAHVSQPPADATPRNTKSKEPPINTELLGALTIAQTRANEYNEKYGKDVAVWCKQANGDEAKLRKIIEHVNATCGKAAS